MHTTYQATSRPLGERKHIAAKLLPVGQFPVGCCLLRHTVARTQAAVLPLCCNTLQGATPACCQAVRLLCFCSLLRPRLQLGWVGCCCADRQSYYMYIRVLLLLPHHATLQQSRANHTCTVESRHTQTCKLLLTPCQGPRQFAPLPPQPQMHATQSPPSITASAPP